MLPLALNETRVKEHELQSNVTKIDQINCCDWKTKQNKTNDNTNKAKEYDCF